MNMMIVGFYFLLLHMRTTLNFQFEVLYSCRQIEYGQGDNVKTYIVWVERLITFCYLMAYHAVRWPINLVSQWES